MSTMISAVLRREARLLAVSRSPAAEWPLAGFPCPRAVSRVWATRVGYCRGGPRSAAKYDLLNEPWRHPCAAADRGLCSRRQTLGHHKNRVSEVKLCGVPLGGGMFVERTVQLSRELVLICRELSSLSKHLTSTNNFTLKCCRGTISWRRDRCLWTSDGVVNGTRYGRHSLQLDLELSRALLWFKVRHYSNNQTWCIWTFHHWRVQECMYSMLSLSLFGSCWNGLD